MNDNEKKLYPMDRLIEEEMEGWTLDDWKQLEIRFMERLVCLSVKRKRAVIEEIKNADEQRQLQIGVGVTYH